MDAPPPGAARPAAKTLRPHQLSGVASKSYSVASAWDRSACLDEQQLQLVDQVSAAVSQRPYPPHLQDDKADAYGSPARRGSEAATAAAAAFSGSLEDAVLQNANQFHKWHAELEAACATETEQKYEQFGQLLKGYLASVAALQAKVQDTLCLFDGLIEQHKSVNSSTSHLSDACKRLLAEKASLVDFADALRTRLKFFDEYEAVAAQFAAAVASPDSAALLPLLNKLDDCIAYVAANPQYADAVAYANKCRQLQARALGLVKGQVQLVLRNSLQQVAAAVADSTGGGAGGGPGAAASNSSAGPLSGKSAAVAAKPKQYGAVPVLSEGLEVSLLYVRFRAAAEPQLKPLLVDLQGRASRPEYQRLLSEVHKLYCAARHQLVSPYVAAKLQVLSEAPLPQLVREGTEQLLRVGQLEAQLMEQFFADGHQQQQQQQQSGRTQPQQQQQPAPALPGELLQPLLEPLGQLLYDVLRPRLVLVQDVDDLCQLIDILTHEVLADSGGGGYRATGISALRPTLSLSLADLQERLIYRAHAFIKDEVAAYQPEPQDVDYPAKLEAAAAEAAAAEGGAADNGEITADPAEEGADQSLSGPQAPWFGPVRSVLLLLSKLYRCVDARTFSGLAQDAISAAAGSVQAAAKLVGKGAGPLDAQLFVIRHLLFLREQIAPFQVDFAVTAVDLDFTHMRDHIRRIMSGEASVFTLSANNAVVQMLGSAGPRVVTAQLDSKRELEAQLKAACESYIMALTKMAIEPLLGFLTKVTAVRVAGRQNPALAKPLPEQAFAAPDKLSGLVTSVNEAMNTRLPAAVKKTQLYLPHPATRAILFRPIKSNIAEAHGQIAQLLQTEYPAEVAAQVPLMQPAALGVALDALT